MDLVVERGELVSLIGPNGSGKTTLFNCVTGFLPADGGRVTFKDRDVTGAAPHRIARLGLARTFQQVSVFARLSALDNLLVFLQQHQEEQLAGPSRAHAAAAAAGDGGDRARPRAARPGRARRQGGGAGRQPVVRPAQAAGLRGRPHARPRPAPARRASRRRQSDHDRADEGPHPGPASPGQDGAAGRAQHGRRDGHLRAGRRARPRPEDRRGAALRDPPRPAASSRRTLAGERALLALDGVVAGYDEIEVLRGVTVEVGAGRDRLDHRRQRRRQVDAAAYGVRHAAAAGGHDPARRPGDRRADRRSTS